MAATLQIGSEYLTSQGGDILEAVVEAELPRFLSHGRAILPTARVLLQRDSVTSAVLEDTLLLYMDEWPVLYGRVVPGGYQVFGHRVELQLEAYLPNPPVTYESTELQSIGAIAKEIADNNGIAVRPSSFWDPQGAFVLQGRAAVPSPRPVLDLLAQAVWEGTGLLSFVPIRSETTDDEGNVTFAWSTQGQVIERLRHKAADTPVIQTSLEEPHVGGDRRYPLANYIDVRPTGVQPLTFKDQASIDLYGVQALPGPIYLSFVSTRFMASLWAAYYLGRFSNLQIFCDVKVDGYWPLGDPWVANLISGDPMVFAPEFADGDVYQTWKARYDLVASTSKMTGLRVLDVAPPTEGLTPVGGGGGEGEAVEVQTCWLPVASHNIALRPTLNDQSPADRTNRDYRPSFTATDGTTQIADGTVDVLPTAAGQVDPAKPFYWTLTRRYSADASIAEPWVWGDVVDPLALKPAFASDAVFSLTVAVGEAIYWELPKATYEGQGVLDYEVSGLRAGGQGPQLAWNKGAHRIQSSGVITTQQVPQTITGQLTVQVLRNNAPVKDRTGRAIRVVQPLLISLVAEDTEGTPVGNVRNLTGQSTGDGYRTALMEWDLPANDAGEADTTGILRYRAEWRDRAIGGQWQGQDTQDAAHTQMPLRDLVPGAQMEGRVQAVGDKDKGYADSGWEEVTWTQRGVREAITLSAPTPPTITGTGSAGAPLTLGWPAATPTVGVAEYLIQKSRTQHPSGWTEMERVDGDSTSLVLHQTPGSNRRGDPYGLWGTGQWYFRVQAIANDGTVYVNSAPSASVGYNFTVQTNPIGTPTGLQAPTSHVGTRSAHLSAVIPTAPGSARWSVQALLFRWAHDGAVSATNPWQSIRVPVGRKRGGDRLSASPSGLRPNTRYQWQCIAEPDEASQRADPAWTSSAPATGPTFITQRDTQIPEGAVATPTAPGERLITKNSFVPYWTQPPSGAAGYIIDIWEQAVGGDPGTVRSIPINGGGTTSRLVAGLTAGRRHGWNVRATPQPGYTESGRTADRFFSTLADPDGNKAPKPTGAALDEQRQGADLDWDRPTARGATAIIGYMVRYRAKTTPAAAWQYERVTGGDTTAFPLRGLTGTGLYEAGVKSRVQPGRTTFPTEDSDYVAFPDFTPLPQGGTPPVRVGDPRQVALKRATSSTLTIGMRPPASTAGFRGFTVRWRKQAGGRQWSQFVPSFESEYDIPNLDAATTWVVEVESAPKTGYLPSRRVRVVPNPATLPVATPTTQPAPANPVPRPRAQYRIGQTSVTWRWNAVAHDNTRRGFLFEYRIPGGTWTALPEMGTGQVSASVRGLPTSTNIQARIRSLGQHGAADATPVSFPLVTTRARTTIYTAAAVNPVIRDDNISSSGFRIAFSQADKNGTAYYEVEVYAHGDRTTVLASGRTTSTSSSQTVQISGRDADTQYDVLVRAIGGTYNGNDYRNSGWSTTVTVRTKASTGGTTPPPNLPASPTPTGLSTSVYNTGLHGGQHQTKRIEMSWNWSGNLASNVGFVVSFTNAAGQAVRFTTTRTSANYYMSPADGFVFNWSVQALGDASSFGPSGTASDSYTF